MPVNLDITVTAADGRYIATVTSSDDVIGSRAGTAEAAALRAVSLFFKVHPDAATWSQPHPADAYAQQHPADAFGPLVCVTAADIRNLIEDAISEEYEVSIVYRDAEDKVTERTIAPFRFRDGRNGELVESFDDLRGQVRNFRLASIQRAEVA